MLIRCWLLLPLQDSVIVLYFVTLCPFLFCNHLDGEERELADLLSLSPWRLLIVVWLFLSVPWVCLQFVIVIYSLTILGCHSCEQRWLWRVCTFAWSSLSPRHSSKFSCGESNGDWMPFWASSEGSGESAHLHRLTLAFVTVQNLLCCVKWRFVCYSRQQRITLVSLHICAGKVTGQCNKYQDPLCLQQRLLGVCTFEQARLSLLHSIEISCSGWNGDFCNVYVNSEWCGESAPATTGLRYNNQCIVSML